jgi:peptide/nickel transport system permease protein
MALRSNDAAPLEAQTRVKAPNRLWRSFKEQPLALIITAIFLAVAIGGPEIAPYPFAKVNMQQRLRGPSSDHFFGTDEFGRDVLSRVVTGARIAFSVCAASILVAMAIGIPMGLAMGFYRGPLDYGLSRFVDALQSFPVLLLAIALSTVLGPSLETSIIVIGIVSVPAMARVTRSAVLNVRESDFVLAARATGAKDSRIIFRAILPNSISPLIIQISYLAPVAILWESGLSFLGLGVRPPAPSWGNLINSAKNYMFQAPYYVLIVGGVITAVIVGLNLLGDGLRVWLDPKLRR